MPLCPPSVRLSIRLSQAIFVPSLPLTAASGDTQGDEISHILG